jgi:hypothetical protein
MFLAQHLATECFLYPYPPFGVCLYLQGILSRVLFANSKPAQLIPIRDDGGPRLSHPRNRLHHLPRTEPRLCEPGSRAATNGNSREGPHSPVF